MNAKLIPAQDIKEIIKALQKQADKN